MGDDLRPSYRLCTQSAVLGPIFGIGVAQHLLYLAWLFLVSPNESFSFQKNMTHPWFTFTSFMVHTVSNYGLLCTTLAVGWKLCNLRIGDAIRRSFQGLQGGARPQEIKNIVLNLEDDLRAVWRFSSLGG